MKHDFYSIGKLSRVLVEKFTVAHLTKKSPQYYVFCLWDLSFVCYSQSPHVFLETSSFHRTQITRCLSILLFNDANRYSSHNFVLVSSGRIDGEKSRNREIWSVKCYCLKHLGLRNCLICMELETSSPYSKQSAQCSFFIKVKYLFLQSLMYENLNPTHHSGNYASPAAIMGKV